MNIPQQFLTRVKVVDKVKAQVIPLQVHAERPPQLKNVRLGIEEESNTANSVPQQSFLRQYVSFFVYSKVQTNISV